MPSIDKFTNTNLPNAVPSLEPSVQLGAILFGCGSTMSSHEDFPPILPTSAHHEVAALNELNEFIKECVAFSVWQVGRESEGYREAILAELAQTELLS